MNGQPFWIKIVSIVLGFLLVVVFLVEKIFILLIVRSIVGLSSHLD